MEFVIAGWDLPSVPVAGSPQRFPVRHIYCVGRNYAEHAKEMGSDASREPPFFFTKAADAVVAGGGIIPYPPATEDFHHEVELVVAIGGTGANVTPAAAQALIYGYAIGLDMTRRDLQQQMKDGRRPWDIGKSFAAAAPIGPIHPVAAVGHPARGEISLDVNGHRRQSGDLSDMIWDVPHTLAYLSQFYTLQPGDLVFTGTPAGVGAVVPGDRLVGRIAGLGELQVEIGPRS